MFIVSPLVVKVNMLIIVIISIITNGTREGLVFEVGGLVQMNFGG